MLRRRERDARRVARSIRTHEETMAAFGRASQRGVGVKGMNPDNKSGFWKFDHSEIQNVGGTESIGGKGRTRDARLFTPLATLPGDAHIRTYSPNIAPSGRYRGMDIIQKGTTLSDQAKAKKEKGE